VGEETDREQLIHFLQGGYTSAKIVEERGDFSVRGAILDIDTPYYEEPLRLEFDGTALYPSAASIQRLSGPSSG